MVDPPTTNGEKGFIMKNNKKVTMEQFINEKIAVRTGLGANLDKFLKWCGEAGLRWVAGQEATEYRPDSYGEELCITSGFHKDNRLEYSRACFYSDHNWQVVDFSVFIGQPASHSVVITFEGDTTIAELVKNGKTVKKVEAYKHPADKYDRKVGAVVAVERLFEKKKAEYKEVHRRARVGEYVKLLTNGGYGDSTCKPGSIHKVTSLSPIAGIKVPKHNFDLTFYDREYVVLEGYKE